MMEAVIDRLDSREAAAAAITAHRVEHLRVGAERLVLAAHWCDLHPAGEDTIDLPGRPRAKRSGADGTPDVDEFAAEELGCLLGIHPHAAHNLTADAVNLRHRHPRLWARVCDGEVVDWVAVKTARLVAAAGLTLAQARWVDEVTADYVMSLPVGRYLSLVEARIIAADPEAAERRREAAALDRFVRTGQSTEHGIKSLVARATAGEIIYLVAVVDRIAQILALQGDTDSADVRRSKALGILATPARALQLLAWAEDTGDDAPPDDAPPDDATDDRACHAGNAEFAETLARIDLQKLLPKAVIYVHVSAEAVAAGFGVARVEDVGPVTLAGLRDLLGHSHVTVRPVLDLAGGMPVDCYEIPDRMREVVTLRSPYAVFPWSSRTSRGADADHSKPYRPGIRGQTHPDNLGPLPRRHHRLKTHAPGWRHHRLAPEVWLWRTPTGHWSRVDKHGTHYLGRQVSVLEEHFKTLLAA
jgi:hypothetical protein